jgi:NAD+ diphosphatase
LTTPGPFARDAHLRKDLGFLEGELRAGDTLLLPVWREQPLVVGGDTLALVPLSGGAGLLEGDGELVWLGKLGAQSVFAIDVSALPAPDQHPLLSQMEPKDLRLASATLPTEQATLAAYARAILHWHGRQRHCGVCGGPTAPRDGGHLRVCRAEACKTEFFPRTDPAVIVLVHDGDRILLGRQSRWPKGMYSTLAGFVEPGETIEEAVAREILEESGVRVDDVRYFRSQPWPYPASLMIGFFARAVSTEIDLGEQELEDARWFERAQVADAKAHGFFVPGPFSIAGQLVAAWLAGETPRLSR